MASPAPSAKTTTTVVAPPANARARTWISTASPTLNGGSGGRKRDIFSCIASHDCRSTAAMTAEARLKWFFILGGRTSGTDAAPADSGGIEADWDSDDDESATDAAVAVPRRQPAAAEAALHAFQAADVRVRSAPRSAGATRDGSMALRPTSYARA